MTYALQKSFPLLMAMALFFTGCTEDSDEQAIDRSYLDSEKYQEFEQQSVRERFSRTDEATAFERILSNFLTDPQTEELNLPAKIDSSSLDKYLDPSAGFELKQSMLNEPAEMDYTYYPVGRADGEEIRLLFFLIRKQSVYDDVELAVATFKDTSMIKVQSLAEFKKTISLRVQSTVQIDRSLNIISEIVREPFYPVRQEFYTTYRYDINRKGEIEEEVISEDS